MKEINNVETFTLELNLVRMTEDNVSMKQMKESMEASHEGTLELNVIELETFKIEKGIEQEKCKININRLEIKHDQVLIELK